ncbi:MAG: hypothetical protein AMK72_07685 [Planctomycetes bacterium SM23_25]|jgi:outer membrane lipoprotein-sorting protein|nr:MAG: hypothetical protein AMK72_07685 [Planctomycetes bacterium SM23_25]
MMRWAQLLGFPAIAAWLALAATQPATQPAATRPAATQALSSQPAETQPAATQPVTDEALAGLNPGLLDPKTGQPDLTKVLDHINDLFRADRSISTVTLVVTRPRRTRTMELNVRTQGTEKALIRVQNPARDRGTATLKVGDNLWNYLPKISRTIRIPPSMMLSSWMGSDLTNDDLVRASSLVEDFHARLLGRGEDGQGWQIELRAKEGVVGLWEKIEYELTPDASLPVRARYYDRKGRLARRMEFLAPKEFDGRTVPSHLVLTPVDKQGHKTELLYSEMDFSTEVPDSTFSLSELERSR